MNLSLILGIGSLLLWIVLVFALHVPAGWPHLFLAAGVAGFVQAKAELGQAGKVDVVALHPDLAFVVLPPYLQLAGRFHRHKLGPSVVVTYVAFHRRRGQPVIEMPPPS